MNHAEDFAGLKAAVLAEASSKNAKQGEEFAAVMMALLRVKEATHRITLESLQARDKSEVEKARAESLHLRHENLQFKRAHLLTNISQALTLDTPHCDAISKETSKVFTINKFKDNADLKKKHEQVLKLLLEEQINRKSDKLALEQRRKAQAEHLAELDSKRRFLDEEMHKAILEVNKTVQSVAKGFQE
jgi:hypothetical protein